MLKNDKKDTRRIMTTKGILAILRTILRPIDKVSMSRLYETEQVKCISPLDILLKIDHLPFKMTREMMGEVAFWGQNQASFKSASAILKKVHDVNISSETVRAVTDYVGKIVFEEDTRKAKEAYEKLVQMRYTKTKDGVLYIQADGAALNTRTKNNEGSTWRENKLGMVFSSDNIRKTVNKKGKIVDKIEKKEYTSYIGKSQEFKKYLFACAVRNGYGQYKETILLSDGAAWIRMIGEELFPDAIQILDLFHLCENIYNYAKAVYKNDEAKYKPWAENLVEKFKNGEKHEAIQEIKAIKNRKLPKGTVNLYTYVINNINKIDYKEYKEKGYYVGSGAIESGNRVVLHKRLKLAGMRWDDLSAQYLLSLRAKYESDLWHPCVIEELLAYNFERLLA